MFTQISNFLDSYVDISLKISNSEIRNFSTDSREIPPGSAFIAIEGEKFDGHDFIVEVLKVSDPVCVFSHLPKDKIKDIGLINQDLQDRIIVVKDTLSFFHQVARFYRRQVNPLTIGITGSNGKTTTKELLAVILKQKFKVHATTGNFNNQIGVPKTILSMPEDTEVLILEMAMRGLGEIELLTKTGEPNLAIITNIGTAHIERLGSREAIRQAKLEIIQGLVAHKEHPPTLYVDHKLGQFLQSDVDYQKFIIEKNITVKSFDQTYDYTTNFLLSPGLRSNISAVSKLALSLGLSREEVKKGLADYHPGKGRGLMTTIGEKTFVDETYNASPESVRNSVSTLKENFSNYQKIIVLGTIAESLPELVDELFAELARDEHLTLIDARKYSQQEIVERIKNLSGKAVILFKASRVGKLEEVLEKIVK